MVNLFARQMQKLPAKATKIYLEGLDKVGFMPDRVPEFKEVNKLLMNLTGWQIYEVPGIVPNREFFELLSQKKFPATTWLRKMEQLDYLEEPDMFHDVFGHVPVLSNQHFVDFLQGISQIALKHVDDEWAIELISRIYWFTVEFGLIEEDSEIRIYGAGILSSNGETDYCLGDIPSRLDFDVNAIIDSPFIKEKFQDKYFIIRSYEQLYNHLPEFEKALEVAINQPSTFKFKKPA